MILIAAVAMAGYTAISAASLAPAGWDAGLKLTEARDLNPDPKIVEVELTARVADVEVAPGHVVHAWTYDGSIPGPLIRAHVGDRVIVLFTNDLPQSTTVHWHGLRVPIEMDGVPDVSQPELQRGDTFTYDFIVRDAGLYWYHPHVMSAAQVGFGLYGALLVDDAADLIGVADELTLVLSDIGFDGKGVLDSPDTTSVIPNRRTAESSSSEIAAMVFARHGRSVAPTPLPRNRGGKNSSSRSAITDVRVLRVDAQPVLSIP
jgi:FtsP/CotA-like multicopper oxidase with cupredoxin domain